MTEETQATEEVVVGSDEYNAQMSEKFNNQEAKADEQIDKVPVTEMPENGQEKFYNAETGEYDWQNHAKELEYRLKKDEPEEAISDEDKQNVENTTSTEANDIVVKAGLNPEDLKAQLETDGDLSDEAYAALEQQGLRRDLVELYVDNLNYRREQQTNEAINYAGGEQQWEQLSQWAGQNLANDEAARYNELLASPEWKVAIDALRVRRDSAHGEPSLMGGNNSVGGSQFGYRSKAEMKADMSDARYTTDPAFRQDVMKKIQSATWDLG